MAKKVKIINNDDDLKDIINQESGIVPMLSEQDLQEMMNTPLPDNMPLLVLRNIVLFPGIVVPVTIGRHKSLKLVDDAYNEGMIIGTVAQKDEYMDNPRPKDLYRVGTSARILKLFSMPDGTKTVLLQGMRVFSISKIYDAFEDQYHYVGYFRADVKEMNFNEESQQEKKEQGNNKDTQIIEVNIQDNTKENKIIIDSNNNDIKSDKNEKKEKVEPIQQNNKNDEDSQISLSRIMSFKSNIECKPSLVDDSSSISDGYTTHSVKNYKNNNNIGLSSEKSLSFISDNNNINKFLLNEIKLEHNDNDNDKIIKELASELEQSTAKKDKLASNKKEIDSKFKNICNNIEPVNLSRKTGQNISSDNKPKEADILDNKKEDIVINNKNKGNNYKNQIYEYKDKNNNKFGDKNLNNILNNTLNIDNINKNINELNLTKTTQEEDHNNNITNINNSNLNELIQNKIIGDENSNIHNINKSINESSISNLNPIKINNEIYLNDNNSNNFNKKLHAVDQKLLNLELYTKEKILDLISQINFIKKNFKLPIKDPLSKEKINPDLNPLNRTQINDKYRTFNNNLISSQNPSSYQNSFLLEKNKENIPNNNASNSQYIYKNNTI